MSNKESKKKYDLFSKSNKQTKETTDHVYLTRWETERLHRINVPLECFKAAAYSKKSLTELYNMVDGIVKNIQEPPQETIADMDSTLLKNIMDTHGAIKSCLIQFYGLLCKYDTQFEIIRLRSALEIEIAQQSSIHPYIFCDEFSEVSALKLWYTPFLSVLKKCMAIHNVLQISTEPKPEAEEKAPTNVKTTKEKSVKTSPDKDEKLPSVLTIIVETVLDMDLPAMTFLNKFQDIFGRALAEQETYLLQTKKVKETQLQGQMRSIRALIMKKLIEEKKVGLIKPPTFLIKFKLLKYSFEGVIFRGKHLYGQSLGPNEKIKIRIKTTETQTDERKMSNSILESNTAETKREFQTNSETESKLTQSDSEETKSYLDNTLALGASLGVNANNTTEAGSSGATQLVAKGTTTTTCGVNLDMNSDYSTKSGVNNLLMSSLETEVNITDKAISKSAESGEQHREISASETNQLTTTKIAEESTEREVQSPAKQAPVDIAISGRKIEYIVIHCVDSVEFWFSNGVQTCLLDFANLASELARFVDDESVKKLIAEFKSALKITDYKNRIMNLEDVDSPYPRIFHGQFEDIFKANVAVRDGKGTITKNDKGETILTFSEDDLDKDLFSKRIWGVPFRTTRHSLSIPGTSTEWIVRDHCLGEIDCHEKEKEWEATDIQLEHSEALKEKDAVTVKAMEAMLEHCKNHTEAESFRTDAFYKLFVSSDEILSKSLLLTAFNGMLAQNNSEGRQSSKK
jgi:hypothetical protein